MFIYIFMKWFNCLFVCEDLYRYVGLYCLWLRSLSRFFFLTWVPISLLFPESWPGDTFELFGSSSTQDETTSEKIYIGGWEPSIWNYLEIRKLVFNFEWNISHNCLFGIMVYFIGDHWGLTWCFVVLRTSIIIHISWFIWFGKLD